MNASPDSAHAVTVKTSNLARIASAQLLGDSSLIVIEHAGQDYFLRRTKAGKLILTK